MKNTTPTTIPTATPIDTLTSIPITTLTATPTTTPKITPRTALKIMGLLTQKSDITRQEMADYLSITINGVKYHLRKMQKKNLIRRVGPNNGGHWEVVR